MSAVKTVLLAEEGPGDVRPTQEAFRELDAGLDFHVAVDGAEAARFVPREGIYVQVLRPEVILPDLKSISEFRSTRVRLPQPMRSA
jgi:hypothetical protein